MLAPGKKIDSRNIRPDAFAIHCKDLAQGLVEAHSRKVTSEFR